MYIAKFKARFLNIVDRKSRCRDELITNRTRLAKCLLTNRLKLIHWRIKFLLCQKNTTKVIVLSCFHAPPPNNPQYIIYCRSSGTVFNSVITQ